MAKKRKYTGEWDTQCPYCLSKRIKVDGYWDVWTDEGRKHREWVEKDTASCLACGRNWMSERIYPPGCPHCGCIYALDMTNVPETAEEAAKTGTAVGVPAWCCRKCGSTIDQDTGKVLVAGTKKNTQDEIGSV